MKVVDSLWKCRNKGSDVIMKGLLVYTLKQWNFYLWDNDFLKSHPRIVIGIDFAM